MRKLMIYIGLIGCIMFNLPALAGAETKENVLKMEELSIQIMPEFAHHPDDKEQKHSPLLIGYHGTFMNNSDQAQKGLIEIPLPMEAENFRIGFVADYSSDLSQMNEIEYELNKERGTISWETSNEIQSQELYKFVVEFYTDEIADKNDSKHLTYSFETFTDIGMLNLLFVEPMKTDSFKLDPASDSHQKNTYGMNMFIYQLGSVKEGTEKTIELEYKRSTKSTTTEIMNEMQGVSNNKAAEKDNTTIPTWMAATIVGSISLLLAVGLILFLKRNKKQNKVVKEKENDTQSEQKKARLRAMLLEGSITEGEYQELIKKVGKS